MHSDQQKSTLLRYLNSSRNAVLFKLEGVCERDLRMPMTATGTNLLGVVKHLATVEAGYFGECLGEPFPEHIAWYDSDEPNADMFATADESVETIIGLYERVLAFANARCEALPLSAPGHVPWWGDAETTLFDLLVHMITETARHAGHIDIIRESIDGEAGVRRGVTNMPDEDAAWWAEYVDALRGIAEGVPREAPGRT